MTFGKMLLAASVFCISFAAHAADLLVQYEYNAGFSPTPGSEVILIHSDGKVVFSSRYLDRGNGDQVRTRYILARLNKDKMVLLNSLISTVSLSDLKDLNEGEPMCTDAPSSAISVMQGNVAVAVTRQSGCHTWVNETQQGQQVKQIMDGLVALSQLQ